MKKVKSKNEPSLFKVFRYLFHSVREFKLSAILTVIFIAGESILECIIPFVMSKLLDVMSKTDSNVVMQEVIIFASILIVLACLSLTCGILAGKFAATASSGFAKNLRQDLFYKLQTYSFENIDKFQVSSLVTRQTTDVSNVQMAYMMLIRTAIRSPLMLIFSIVMSIIQCPKISWIFCITIPVLTAGLIVIISNASPLFQKVFKKYDKLNESIEENVRGMRVVKTYTREEFEKDKFKTAAWDMQKGFIKAERVVTLNNPLMQFSMYLSMLLFLFVGSTLILDTAITVRNPEVILEIKYIDLSVGQLSSLITYSAQVLSSLMMLSMVLVMITMSTASAKRIYEVLVENPTLDMAAKPLTEIKNGDIDFNNVSFKYDKKAEKYSLNNVNLHIKSGQTIGIIGGTGSAKSTLVNLISRFYDTTEGEVLVAGQNVKNYDIHALRNNIGMVLQKNVLFSGTIKSNLLWGNKEATDEEIKKAAHIAQADSFIDTFPDGYNSRIEQGGSNVSGGQKQRLCIARALLKKPKILIFDDSTSAVDTKTDAFIRKGLKESLPDTTKIIIAQRVSSVEDADFIIVMDDGHIDAIGTHDELVKSNEIYKEVYTLQTKKGE